jgi:D-alanyl-D-alanine carboxypeptidase
MRKVIRYTFFTSALFVGLIAGFFLVTGIQAIKPFVVEFVSNTDLFEEREINQGGPDSGDIFEDKKGEDVYFLNYEKSYQISDNAPVPRLTAQSYLVGDIESGQIIISRNENQALPIASITKLMTALVADDSVGLSTDIRISERALDTYGKQGNLNVNEVYKVSEILYPLLLESSNDASEAIAESYGRDNFLRSMRDKARKIEMYSTNFSDPSGLSPQNISTVSDLFKLTKYIEEYRNYIFGITREKGHELRNKVWFNNSKFRSEDDYYGGKNGYTDIAWKTQLAVFEMDFDGEKRKLVYIILKTDDIEGDIFGLKRYVERHVDYK